MPVEPTEQNFFDGIDTSLPGLAKLAGPEGAFLQQPLSRIHEIVAQAILNYAPDHPERTAPLVADVSRRIAKLLDQVKTSSLDTEQKASVTRELEIKLQQANMALSQALGIEMTALVMPGNGGRGFELYAGPRGGLSATPQPVPAQVTPGEDFRVRVHIRAPKAAALNKVTLETPRNERWTVQREGAPGLDDPHSTSGDVVFHVIAAQDAAPTAPYFSRPSTEQAYYDIAEPEYRNLSFAPYPVTGVATFDYDGVPLRLAQVVQTMHTELGPGACMRSADRHAGAVGFVGPAVDRAAHRRLAQRGARRHRARAAACRAGCRGHAAAWNCPKVGAPHRPRRIFIFTLARTRHSASRCTPRRSLRQAIPSRRLRRAAIIDSPPDMRRPATAR